jgi:hypothetical protein
MANRQTTFLIKRSNVPGKVPPSSGLTSGELALNTADAILYTSGSTENQILPIGWDRIHRTGDTVTGNFVFNGNIDVTSISPVDYINFNTNPTVPSATGGTLYFDSNENALSYKPITEQNDVTVNLGQESLIRVYNGLSTTILNGQVLHITGATSGIPTVALANASKLGTAFTESLAQTSGVATHDIEPGDYGFMTNFGIVRDLNTSAFTVGSEVFLSDTVDGALTNDPNSIAYTSRISTVGYCLESHPTTGKILVVIYNENPLQSLTQQEINVLLGNTISTGAYEYTGMTKASSTTVNVAPMRGWIVYNTDDRATNPLVLNIYYSGGTNIPVTNINSSLDTYFLVNSGGTLYQQTTFPTPVERRNNIFLGRAVHPNKTDILNVEQSVDYDVSPLSSLRDLWTPIRLINQGVIISNNGANLTFKTSSGTFWGNGIGWDTNQKNPNSITVAAQIPAVFYYTTQTGGTFTTTASTIDTTSYDVNGVITPIPGTGNYSTQRIYMSQSGVIRIQYGQVVYPTLAKAIAALPSELFIENADNAIDCILIGTITVKDGATDLSNIDDAVFSLVSKFGEVLGGTAGISTTTLQQAYNNSVNPEITTDSVLGGVQFKGGTGSNTHKNIIIENNSGTETAYIRADGFISGSSLNAPNLIISGGTQSIFSGNTSTDLLRVTQTGTGNAFVVEDDSNPDSNPFVITSGGSVGIGTTTPSEKLDVSGKTKTINFQMTSGATPGYFLTTDGSGNASWSPINISTTELDPVLSVLSSPPISNTVGDRYLIGSGSTGIWSGRTNDIAEYTGTTSPFWSYTIPIGDNIVYVTDTLVTYYYNGSNWIPWRGTAILQNGNSLTTSVNIGTNNNQNLTFRTSGQTRMTVTSGGTIGIGTTTPVYPLDIRGNDGIRISGSTHNGALIIRWTANNALDFFHTGIGTLFGAGPTNRVTFGDQELVALKRGGRFASDQPLNPFGLWVSGLPVMPSGSTIDLPSILIAPTINNNSLYSGITRGIYYNPTVTSLGSINIHRAIETTSGDLLFSNTSLTAITRTGGINIISGNTNNDMLRITQTGSGNAFVVEDSTNPDSSPFVINNVGNVGIGVTSTTQNLQVAGTSLLSGSGQNILTVIGSGNSTTSPLFSVQGSSGELFSVSDSLTGSLFSVNDISGLPIVEVFSDNTTLMGSYLAPSLNTTTRTSLTAGTNTVYSIPTSAYTGAFFEYTLISTGSTGARAGQIMSIWSGTSAQYTETTTNDIGTTTGVTFSVAVSGNNAVLSSSATTSGWTLKTIVRSI